MSDTVIKFEDVSKYYRLGVIGSTTIRDDFRRVVARLRGQSDPTLQLDAVDYGNQDDQFIWALRDINLSIKQGEVLGIIGTNGAGKSTLLKLLSRVTGPTSGQIKVKGRIGSLLEVGTGFHPELTGRENVFLNGAILGMTRQEITRKFDEIVDFSGVEKYIDTPVKRYSSGMNVRLGFAVAAHLDPEILVVDEVLAVGDAKFQKMCLGKMGDVAQEGRTVLFVSHNMGSIRQLCKRAIVLQKGQILTDDTVGKAVEMYLNPQNEVLPATIDLPPKGDIISAMVQVMDRQGNKKTQFNLHEPFVVRVDFEIEEKYSHFIAAVGLVNALGTPILNHWSKPLDIEPGKYRVDFLVDAPLSENNFTINIGLSSHEVTLYYQRSAVALRINRAATEDNAPTLSIRATAVLVGQQEAEIIHLRS